MGNKFKQLASDTLMMAVGQFSSKILSFLLVPLYTYVLTTEEYGIYDIINVTISLLTPILTCVILEGVLRFALDKKYNQYEILTIGSLFVAIASLLIIVLYPLLSLIDTMREYYIWFFLLFFLSAFESVLMQYLRGTNRVKFYAICGVLSTFAYLLFNILFLLIFKWGFSGYLLAVIISKIVVIVIICIRINYLRSIVNPFTIRQEVYKDVLKYTVPMIPNSLCWWVSNSSDKYMLLWLANTSVVGVYSVAYKIPSILSVFISIFMSAFQISAMTDFGTNESKDFFSKSYRMFASFVFMVSTGVILFSKFLAFFLYQKEFFDAWKCSTILVVAFAFNSLSALLGTVYTSAKKTLFLFYSTIIAAIVNIILNYFLIQKLGSYGAAIATMISYGVVWVVRIINSKKIFDFEKNTVFNIISSILLVVEVCMMIKDDNLYLGVATLMACIVVALNSFELKKLGFFDRIHLIIKKKKKE